MGEKIEDRHERLLLLVKERGSVRLTDLAAHLGVSLETARRDVTALAAVGKLRRVHGSVSWPSRPLNARDARLARQPQVAVPTGVTLGIVVPTAGYFYQRILRGARVAAAAAGARLVVSITEYRADRDTSAINEMVSAGADGLILTPSWDTHAPDEKQCAQIADLPVPAVLLERRIPLGMPGAQLDRVGSDHAAGAALAVEHLAGLGHRNIALLSRSTPTMPDIRRGYHAAIAALGLDDYDLITAGRVAGIESVEQDVVRLRALVERGEVRAALMHTDTDAINLLRSLAAWGVTVPNEFSLVSYDDELAEVADVPLSAIAPAKEAIGETAVKLVLRRLADPAARRTHTDLLPDLKVRDSCGASLQMP